MHHLHFEGPGEHAIQDPWRRSMHQHPAIARNSGKTVFHFQTVIAEDGIGDQLFFIKNVTHKTYFTMPSVPTTGNYALKRLLPVIGVLGDDLVSQLQKHFRHPVHLSV